MERREQFLLGGRAEHPERGRIDVDDSDQRDAVFDELGIRLQVGLQVDDPLRRRSRIQRRLDRAEILLPERHTRRLENPPIPFFAPGQRHAIPMSGGEVDERADRAARPPLLVHQGHGVFEQSDGPSIVVHDVELELAHFCPLARRDLHRQLIVRHLCAVGGEDPEVGRALRSPAPSWRRSCRAAEPRVLAKARLMRMCGTPRRSRCRCRLAARPGASAARARVGRAHDWFRPAAAGPLPRRPWLAAAPVPRVCGP